MPPKNNCFSLNERAEMTLTHDNYQDINPRRVTVEETLGVLRESYEAGLVHMAYAVDGQEINELCSCCSCCCIALSAALRYGLYPHLLSAEMKQETDISKCNNCGKCVDRCQFGARTIPDNRLDVNEDLCYGCGLCVEYCPTDAIKMNDIHP